jgi:AAA family ATPase
VLTLDVTPETALALYPLPAKPTAKALSTAFPPFSRDIVDLTAIHLQEAAIPGVTSRKSAVSSGPSAGQSKTRDWLDLLVKETLGEHILRNAVAFYRRPFSVDLKYVTAAQIIQVTYEGRPRRFRVTKDAPVDSVDRLAEKIGAIAVASSPISSATTVWSVGWDTTVHLHTLDAPSSTPPAPVAFHTKKVFRHTTTQAFTLAEESQDPVEELPDEAADRAYTSVGGLDAQVAKVRQLLEVPLTRPELFAHYGLPSALSKAIC